MAEQDRDLESRKNTEVCEWGLITKNGGVKLPEAVISNG
jgi:hypothetical protein